MEVISSIYNSGYNIKKFYLGSRELNLAYLGNQVIYDEVIGDNDLNYILYEFYGSDTLPNTVEAPVKSATLKGSTKYRDIDTGDILDTFDETKNLELVSVKVPVLTTSNEDGTKTNILMVNEDVTLRGIGDVQDTLDCLTGEVTERIGEIVLDGSEGWKPIGTSTNNSDLIRFYTGNLSVIGKNDSLVICDKITSKVNWNPTVENIYHSNFGYGIVVLKSGLSDVDSFKSWLSQNPLTVQYRLATESIKTVDLTIVDQDGKTINKLNSFNGTTHVSTEVAENSTYPMVSLEVASELQAAMSKVAEDIELIKPVQNDIETTIDTQSNDIDSLLLATTELFEMIL